jgi:hypothetical protein
MLIVALVPLLAIRTSHIAVIMPGIDGTLMTHHTHQLISHSCLLFQIIMTNLRRNVHDFVERDGRINFYVTGSTLPESVYVNDEIRWWVVQISCLYRANFGTALLTFNFIQTLRSKLIFQKIGKIVTAVHARKRHSQIHKPVECVALMAIVAPNSADCFTTKDKHYIATVSLLHLRHEIIPILTYIKFRVDFELSRSTQNTSNLAILLV